MLYNTHFNTLFKNEIIKHKHAEFLILNMLIHRRNFIQVIMKDSGNNIHSFYRTHIYILSIPFLGLSNINVFPTNFLFLCEYINLNILFVVRE